MLSMLVLAFSMIDSIDMKISQSDKKERYPIDTDEHIRAAWNYIHKIRDEDKYSSEQRKEIEGRIVRAWKEKIGGEPPEAEGK